MTEFVIKVEEVAPNKQVTILVEGKQLFSANLKVRNEQILNQLSRFFLQCVRDDINMQDEIEKQEAGFWT